MLVRVGFSHSLPFEVPDADLRREGAAPQAAERRPAAQHARVARHHRAAGVVRVGSTERRSRIKRAHFPLPRSSERL